jgi:hypothetical protein
MAAYEAALELVGQNLAGPGSRQAEIETAWRRVLTGAAPLVAGAPARVIAAVCNAVHQLASTPGARPAQWIETMESLAPQCADVEAFLKLGQVAAWRAGLAHFRTGALDVADALPEPLALAAVGAKSKNAWAAEREKLRRNPWYDPADDRSDSTGLRMVARAGEFRGFGGLFVEPPDVAAAGTDFLVRSGSDCWLLVADRFGATFHRAAPSEFEAAARDRRLPPSMRMDGTRLVLNGKPFEFPALGQFIGVAANANTLALTGRYSHAVLLAAIQ